MAQPGGTTTASLSALFDPFDAMSKRVWPVPGGIRRVSICRWTHGSRQEGEEASV